MPDSAVIQEFVRMVERDAFIEAMERFYADDAIAQENGQEPRRGLHALLEHERKTLAAFRTIRAKSAFPPVVSGERVVINWLFEFEHPAGTTLRLDELAIQEWEDGRMKRERFYYDPSQMRPTPADAKA